MRSFIFILSALVGFAVSVGCDKSAPQSSAHKSGEVHTPGDGHDHGTQSGVDAHGHDGHDHGSKAFTLGVVSIHGIKVKAVQDGDIVPVKPASFDLSFSEGTERPAEVRGWIGAENAPVTAKIKGEPEGAGFHVHASNPDPLPNDARLWVELKSPSGQATGSFALKR